MGEQVEVTRGPREPRRNTGDGPRIKGKLGHIAGSPQVAIWH